MDIELMRNLRDNLKLPNTVAPSEGLLMSEITQLEVKYNQGKEFPKAFREYLYLAGEYFNAGFDHLGEGLDQLQEYVKEDLEKTEQEVSDAFFAFDVLDSMYSVIMLDETDEDPKVYLLMPFLAKGGKQPLLKPNGWKFTDLVNESIRRVKNNIPA